ncbi:FtsW/RodA/SpoVE family cell cycle protein [Paucilactobacillus kaifaensis]|uniref:FtsW/RodA/SpoVE family cell cycle protein n=1 Tax=Paucilactobacillus kaifaensis TaxID=2559921 RepID=UPI0010F8C3D6|nr:FtsW/RodA/SpoVE family cell cycle protein [Paucilactobacillus kaifaensis]
MLSKKFRFLDYYLVIPYLLLCLIGIVMVYSSSADIASQNGGSPTAYLIKQSLYVVMGLVVVWFITAMNIKILQSPRFLILFAAVLLGALLFVKLFGQAVNGAQGWINLGVINIQPAEVCKIFLILYLGRMLSQHENKISTDFFSSVGGPLLLSIIFVVLILIQPDLGGAVINGAIIMIMMLASGISWKKGVIAIFTIIFGFVLVVLPLLSRVAQSGAIHSYQLQRIVAFVNPFGTAQGAGSQLVNSYYALSNGGVFGVGLGNSIQKMGYLPEPNTDFIMAVIGEELGLITVVLIMCLLTIIVARIIWLGVRSADAYSSLVCYGVATFITIQTLFNVGGVTGLLPITGVTFPFVSYGGSSMLVLCTALGCVLNISARQARSRLIAAV